jgi:hypothetical protein
MDISTRKNSLISGVPLGLTISWLNSRPENFYELSFFSEGLCSFIVISYFILSSIFIVIGVTSIRNRMNTSTQELFTSPLGLLNTQLKVSTADSIKMVMYFFGTLLGGLLWVLIA